MGVSERRACQVLGQPRSTQRHVRKIPDDEERLVGQIIGLASQYGRYGYRRITALLGNDGWKVNHKRVERIWRQEVLKVPQKQPKRGRLWLNDGSCIRLRPMCKDHVWSYDMAMDRTSDGRPIRILVIIDEYTRECLSMYVSRRIRSEDVLEQLYELFLTRGVPEHIRSDNGAEFTANAVRSWRFSSSSWRRRRSSETPSPPYFFFQRKKVCSEIPIFRQTSMTRVPDSAWRRAKAICSSVNFDFFILDDLLTEILPQN